MKKMAEITRRRTGELLQKLFGILKENPEGLKAGIALKMLAEHSTLSEYENGTYDNGARRFEKIVRFATVDCVKAGWMIKEKGIWTLTPEGLQALEKNPDPESFYKEAVRLYRIWKMNSQDSSEEENQVEDEELSLNVTFEQAEEQAFSEIEHYISNLNPYTFQDLVAGLLEGMGYVINWVAPPGKDGGLDIIAFSDPLGTKAPRIKVQVKRQQDKIRLDGIKAFVANVNEDDVGIFVSLGGFTKDAEEYCRFLERRKITLVDINKLMELWVEYYGKLSEESKRIMPISPIYFLTPAK